MLIFSRQADLQSHLSHASAGLSIGFVPTMGALHAGHLSLIRTSLRENDLTVVSIFVNPTQFNNPDDLAKYPRTLEADVAKIESISGDVIVFAPTVEDMYPNQTQSESFDFDGLEHQMEGKFRPGHFDGVGTIVKRLFEIVKPDRAYFGEKDFQQLQIIRKLVSKYDIPVEIVGCPIHREENGLAMSSRNERLSSEQRDHASFIYKVLTQAKERFANENPEQVIDFVKETFNANPDFSLEYFEIADAETLVSITHKQPDRKYRAFIAVFARDVRLIDTLELN
jgi:pantoate--beta-alanine ligase